MDNKAMAWTVIATITITLIVLILVIIFIGNSSSSGLSIVDKIINAIWGAVGN